MVNLEANQNNIVSWSGC